MVTGTAVAPWALIVAIAASPNMNRMNKNEWLWPNKKEKKIR